MRAGAGRPCWSGALICFRKCVLASPSDSNRQPFGHKPVLLTPEAAAAPAVCLQHTDPPNTHTHTQIIHDHENNHRSRGQRSPQPISFHIMPPPSLYLICAPSGRVGNLDLISMSGTGGFGDDRSANKQPVFLSHYHSRPPPTGYGSSHACGGNLHPEAGRWRKENQKVT